MRWWLEQEATWRGLELAAWRHLAEIVKMELTAGRREGEPRVDARSKPSAGVQTSQAFTSSSPPDRFGTVEAGLTAASALRFAVALSSVALFAMGARPLQLGTALALAWLVARR